MDKQGLIWVICVCLGMGYNNSIKNMRCILEPTPSPFYTVEQIAQMMQVTEETVRVWLKRKKNPLPYYRVGREYRISISDFDKWLASQRNPNE